MLQVKNISKKYQTGDLLQNALDDVSLSFRDSEFVAILGQSGSGKTTMLNIIGGLDRYDSGDLIINGVSTKQYKDRDWDTYRNHTIGFVFQSYNLIPHQSVLANVELALTISGVSKKERKKRAIEALEKVGLGDQIHKKPNQMSGGQMQRVAIARALVNNPDILLADEPTGALDTETSVQVMEILKEIAKDRLIVMVTHNPELAEQYANRIVRLKDGKIIDDSNPFIPEKTEQTVQKPKKMKKASMSFGTALALSMNNLRTKKARTLLIAFAGSIGIIGIALIFSLSDGINSYISKVQQDTLSTYPINIESQTVDLNAMMKAQQESIQSIEKHDKDKIYSNNMMTSMLSIMSEEMSTNDIGAFKKHLDSQKDGMKDYISAIQYGYNLDLQIYDKDTADGVLQLSPSTLFEGTGMEQNPMAVNLAESVFQEMIGNRELLSSQYDVIAGRWSDENAYQEIMLVVDENNELSDITLYALGLLDQKEFKKALKGAMKGETFEPKQVSYSYEELLGTTFKLVLNTGYYQYDSKTKSWNDMRKDKSYMKNLVNDGLELKVVGILRPNEEAAATSITSAIAYNSSLTEYMINNINDSKIVKQQLADKETDVFTGRPFDKDKYVSSLTMEDIQAYVATLPKEQQAQFKMLAQVKSEKEIIRMFAEQLADAEESHTYEENLEQLGVVDLEEPSCIQIYCTDFESKDYVSHMIEDYNKSMQNQGKEEYVISYTDVVALMMSSVTQIINMISYVLIAFVSISLVVSSIMIGIITYISVLERTKEIGILRSIGASKRNISSVFNAETLLIGFTSGAIGIIVTILLNIPINMIIKELSGVANIAALPPIAAVILVSISMILTLIAGLIPSRIASKKDPVIALRTE